MRGTGITLVALLCCLVASGCGSSEKHQMHFSQAENWSIFESLMTDQPGWNKQSAHELRVLVQAKGDSPHDAESCYLSEMLPGEWPGNCQVYAAFEKRKGITAKGQAELDAGVAKEEEFEATCGVAYHASPGYAEGPQGESVPSLHIDCGDVGESWPLTVKQGLLQCEPLVLAGLPVQRVTFETPDGELYAVNGHALDAGYPEIDPIWKADPTGVAPKMSISPLIDRGLRLCEAAE
jgi:Protein of unknown function (DUF2511)